MWLLKTGYLVDKTRNHLSDFVSLNNYKEETICLIRPLCTSFLFIYTQDYLLNFAYTLTFGSLVSVISKDSDTTKVYTVYSQSSTQPR